MKKIQKRTNGFRPWEMNEKEDVDLAKSSGKIVVNQGEER